MGGKMTWSTIGQVKIETAEINGKTMRIPNVAALFAQLIFEKSSVPVKSDGSNLQPGYCGWRDRGMTGGEPDRVVENADEFTFQRTVLWGNGSTIGGSMHISAGHLAQQNKAVFSMDVDRSEKYQLRVSPGTLPKVISNK